MSELPGPWYQGGLRFECTRCGNCCTGFSGTVTVNDAEITVLAARQEMDEAAFRERCTRVMSDGTVSLREKPNYDCIFWAREHGCLVYEDRPTQCRASFHTPSRLPAAVACSPLGVPVDLAA